MSKTRIALLLAAVLCLFAGTQRGFAAEGQLMAGTAKIDITPADDHPDRPRMPVHDPLYARSLVLEVGDEKVALIALDLAMYSSEEIAAQIREKYDIDLVLFASSHNHSDYSGRRNSKNGELCIEVVGKACENMIPARISGGQREFPALAFNRNIIREDGHARESWHADKHYRYENPDRIPFGPTDPEVGVLKIEDMEGNAKAIVVNYAMHTDIMCFNEEITADFAGVTTQKVEEAFDGANCLFVNGAAGNQESLQISPRGREVRNYDIMDRVGELLAFEAIALAKELKATSDTTTLRQMQTPLQFTGRFDKERKFSFDVATVLINDLAIAVTPGELFVQHQLEWKRHASLAKVTPFFFGYTWISGRAPGYVPDIRSAALGGFGADQSGGMIENGAGEKIVNTQLENLYKLNGLMRDKPYSP